MIPLVLLPGMMCDARLFGPQLAAFSATRTLQVAPIGAADTVQALARQILGNAPPLFALAGLSMGGIVAMEVVRQAPARVRGLALLDTNPKAELDSVRANRLPQIAKVRAGHLNAVMRDELKPNYLTDGPNRAAILDLCMEMAQALGPEVFVNQSQALASRPDQQATLAAYPGPALVLCGREDRLCPVERHELMHALLPHSTLTVIENAGHLPTLENPQQTNAAFARWMERLNG